MQTILDAGGWLCFRLWDEHQLNRFDHQVRAARMYSLVPDGYVLLQHFRSQLERELRLVDRATADEILDRQAADREAQKRADIQRGRALIIEQRRVAVLEKRAAAWAKRQQLVTYARDMAAVAAELADPQEGAAARRWVEWLEERFAPDGRLVEEFLSMPADPDVDESSALGRGTGTRRYSRYAQPVTWTLVG